MKTHEYADYVKAAELQPNNACVIVNIGAIKFTLKEYALALEDFNTAIRLQPDLVLAHYNRATVFNNMGQYKEAIAECSET
ncbi:MAG TPA: tetratricopeptide repeat protein, partial [Flexilinea sp.]|nr:tetratricopeptide repeat protein [Flexilinea sp.]